MRAARSSRRLGTGLAVALLLATAGCGSDEPSDYDEEVRREFLAACADGADEQVCGCWYDRLEAEVPFERFQEISEALAENPDALPDDVLAMLTDCLVEAEGG